MSIEMYCPYCRKNVKASKVSWGWIILTLLTGYIILYLLYCAFNDNRVCKECKRRIYQVEWKHENKL